MRGRDEALLEVSTWQLYDGTLNDEQLTADLARFRQGVRVLVVSDSCGGGMPGLRPSDLNASVLVLAACEEGKQADGAGLPVLHAEPLPAAIPARSRCINSVLASNPSIRRLT